MRTLVVPCPCFRFVKEESAIDLAKELAKERMAGRPVKTFYHI